MYMYNGKKLLCETEKTNNALNLLDIKQQK